ncbi:MAG: GatB/YqeY domain-containing protein [Flavobacteriaceae bacterium]|jgi:uncharacterized protein YqeY|nr:GatB/YqeY domain-containing protein [Flavobacteriaceae bacterium]MDA7849252.1 GatB/YqeY domain-containing protein [Flavobacteriaceae bacterium]MDG1309133.1 GatB/YqeY domain-containing protein [Flavobacteriaceae bacterium]|tara:strand:- start:49 stop:495 length:447 start_codon:yes stop_codon:yes gene_type:complete
MSLQESVMTALKAAMKSKDTVALTALRSVKSAILLAQTSGSSAEMNEEDEFKLLQKLVKQRRDSAAIFSEQNRLDLAEPELAEAEVISQFLPQMLEESEVEKVVVDTIASLGASGMKDMGRVMGVVSKTLAGKTDGKTISTLVKAKLS